MNKKEMYISHIKVLMIKIMIINTENVIIHKNKKKHA